MNRSTSSNVSVSDVKSSGAGLFLTETCCFTGDLMAFRLRAGDVEIVGCIVLAINGERFKLLFLLLANAFYAYAFIISFLAYFDFSSS